MLKGWNKIGNYTYFFKTDGSAPRKWKKIKGKYYYFGKKGRMYTNRIISKKYYVMPPVNVLMVSLRSVPTLTISIRQPER